jgi:lipoyl(octanoyl) transferase
MSDLWVIRLGQVPYEAARDAQTRLAAARQSAEIPDLLLLLEHPPVYTRGRRTKEEELPMGEDWYRAQGIEVCDTDRGGAVTYHGPGQLVGYPIVSLKPYRDDVHAYVRGLEQVMIKSLGAFGIEAGLVDDSTGVWVNGRKVGSIGVHVGRGVTTHGFAVNVNNDLQPFEWIVPCGIDDCRMTSVGRELGAAQDLARFSEVVTELFAEIYARRPVPVSGDELAARVAGIDVLRDATPAADPAAALP